ncbi:hypothetical protein BVY04_00155 [bacterium M21]|nr:hypothetical protein BVY04_00155 [bacterium M21]
MKHFIYSLLILFACTAWAKPPNVVFILADDLGIGGLHCFGTDYLETPNIDRLCSEGMKFTNGLAAYPTCQPSRMAILSGQYGPRTGGYRVMDHHRGKEQLIKYKVPKLTGLALGKTTIAECFKDAGYTTAMYGKWHAGNYSPALHPRYHGFDEAYACRGHYDMTRSDPKIELPEGMDSSEYFTGKAIEFMAKAKKEEKPFFLYMPYYLVHAPLETKKEYIDHFRTKLKDHKFIDRRPANVPVVAAMTKHLDDCVGRLMVALEKMSLDEDTIVVFTSDNGAYIQDLVGGARGQKGWTYDGGLKIPYIFRWKGKIKPKTVNAERIHHVDLYPTFLDLANVDKPKNHPLDGLSLGPLLFGKEQNLLKRSLYCYHPKYAQFNKKTKEWRWSWRNVIYSGDHKLIEWPEYDRYEMYNLADDPKEEKDLASTNPEKRDALKNMLHGWFKEVGAGEPVPNPNYALEK